MSPIPPGYREQIDGIPDTECENCKYYSVMNEGYCNFYEFKLTGQNPICANYFQRGMQICVYCGNHFKIELSKCPQCQSISELISQKPVEITEN